MTSPSNESIGQLLGVSHAAVSRYKSGDRVPELDVMARIAELYDWSIDRQYKARQEGTYASEFIARVSAGPAGGTVGQDAPANQQAGRG